MQRKHLVTALLRALDRYGAPASRTDATPPADADPLAPNATVPLPPTRLLPALPRRARRPGWVTIGEIEASQSPNTYPRLTRKAIRDGCRDLAGQDASPVAEIDATGLRTWVRVVPVAPDVPLVTPDTVVAPGTVDATPVDATPVAPAVAPVAAPAVAYVPDGAVPDDGGSHGASGAGTPT